MKKNYILAFIIPFILMIITFTINTNVGITKSILICDLYHQFISFFVYLKDILLSNQSILYSSYFGLSSPVIGNFAYYLISPFNFLVLFFDELNMDIMFMLISSLKISLASLFMYIFLKYNFKTNDKYLLLFSIMYTLMQYNISYYFCIMWLDNIYLLPLVLLGLDKIIDKKNSKLYMISLFISMMCNYYITYMICLFTLIYFIYKVIIKYNIKDKIVLKITKRYIISSVLVCFAASIILFPLIDELLMSQRGLANTLSLALNTKYFFSQFFIGFFNGLLDTNYFLMYNGLLTLVLLILFFFSKKISQKEKFATLIIFIIIILSLLVPSINYIWHGLSIPNGLNGRQVFIFSLFSIFIALKSLINIGGVEKKYYLITYAILLLISLFTILEGKIDLIYICINIIFISLYLFILYSIKKDERINLILLILVICELFLNANLSFYNYKFITKESVDNNYINTKSDIDYIKTIDSSYYRLEKNYIYTLNDPILFKYSGINYFLSLYNKNVFDFFSKIGITNHINDTTYNEGTIILDSILGIKYRILKNKEIPYYELINEVDRLGGQDITYGIITENIYTYYNKYALNLGYIVNDDIKKIKLDGNPLYNQNLILKTMSNTQDILVEQKVNKEDNNYKIDKNNSLVFIDTRTLNEHDDMIYYKINDIKYKFDNYSQKILYFKDKGNIEIDDVNDVYAYSINYDNFNEAINTLKQNQINIIDYKKNYLKFEIDNKSNNKTLLLTIPYTNNFNIYVDKKKVSYEKLLDTFIGLNINGKHVVEIKYYPKSLNIGITFSIISLVISAIYLKKQKDI